MNLMVWSEHFITGVDLIDRQHKGLVEMINAAAPLLSEKNDVAARQVQPLLEKLVDYADKHFSAEEALMAERGIDTRYRNYHHGIHVAFTSEVELMRKDAVADSNISGNDLLRFLISWLSFHILAEDKQAVRQLRAIEGGEPAAQAYEEIRRGDSPAMSALTDAMIDMFSLLTKRNLELNATKADLFAANQHLEARVAERTRELQTATERIKKAQEQLLQSEKMSAVGQLAAGVAHEINNPIGFVKSNLGALTGYVDQLFGLIEAYETVAAGLPAGHPGLETLRAAQATAELDFLREDIPDLLRDSADGLGRVQRIVSDLKDFSHVDQGEWRQTDLNQCIESTLNVVRNEIKYKAEVIQELGELPLVDCIPSQINQVLMNLLVNAAQAIEEKGHITMRTGVAAGQVWIEVADTGKGMTTEVRRRVFEPFYTTKPVGKGTGLGLSITWDIVERHGGTIEVDSEPGRGTTFRLSLPIERQSRMTA